jgi:DNA helicase HerA-like ATPase
MFPLIFQIPQLPDLKSQKYLSLYGQGTRQKVLSSQKDFLLLLSDLSRVYHLTFSLRYRYAPGLPFDQRLGIYLVVSQSKASSPNTNIVNDITKIITQGFLSQFYHKIKLKVQTHRIQNLNWVTHIGEAIKYEEIVCKNTNYTTLAGDGLNKKKVLQDAYYVPLQFEADEANDMLVVCETIASFNSPVMLEITLQPDASSLQEKSSWINALDQMLTNLRSSSSGSSLSLSKTEDRNAQLVSRIYDKYQSTYLTENLYRYSIKVLGTDELAVRSILGTLLLSGTKKSRYRTIVLTQNHPAFPSSLAATQEGEISTATHWEEWDRELGEAYLKGDISAKNNVKITDLKPLHRYATLNEISGLFRIVVPSDAPVKGISHENEIASLGQDKQWIDFGGYETTCPENPIQIELKQLNKHAFICGVPGSGKTTTSFNLLTQLWCHDIPFLVFEPAKTEYRSLLAIQPDTSRFPPEQLQKLRNLTQQLRVYTLGNDLISPFRFNPFEVSNGVPFYEHISNLEASFRGALPLSGPLPALLYEALEEIYYDREWTGSEEGTPDDLEIPTMRDLYNKITALFETKDYAGEVKSNLKTALEVRIGSLLRRGVGAMLNTQRSSPTISDLLKYPTILELDYLNQDQANLMTFFLLTKIREYVKRQRTEGNDNPEHIILLEEAHNIVGRNLGVASSEDANTKQEAANYITRMLAEMRALREAIIIADQLPTGVAAEVVKNTNVKIAHRLVSADDRKDIGQSMLLDSFQIEEIARLNPGESFLYMEGWYRPRSVKIPEKNSGKVKLGIESSIGSNKLASLIQKKAWYREGQMTMLNTSIQEGDRLCKEYHKTFADIRKRMQPIQQECEALEQLLKELTAEVFYTLSGTLRLNLDPTPENEYSLEFALMGINPSKLVSLDDLQPVANLNLGELLDLRSHLIAKLDLFDRHYQAINETNSRIPYNKYKQQWQQLTRQLQTLHRQITAWGRALGQPEAATKLQQQRDIIVYEQDKLSDKEEPEVKETLRQLEQSYQNLRFKLMDVLNRSLSTAQSDKVKQDFKTGGQ